MLTFDWMDQLRNTSVGGYDCPDCGAWVTPAFAHFCDPPTPKNDTVVLSPIINIDERIIIALELIAISLAKIVEREIE